MAMENRKNEIESPKWLTDELKARVRKVFEVRYKRTLTEIEVITISENLANFMEHFLKFKWRVDYDKS